MKLFFFSFLFILSTSKVSTQTLTNYINQAKKNYTPKTTNTSALNQNSTTSLQFGYFINPQYTISGAQRAYIQLQQEIPWLGKSNSYRKIQKNTQTQIELQKQYEVEQLSFKIKESYYKMYQFKKQKDIYVAWAEKLRQYIASSSKKDSLSSNFILKQFEYETKLIEATAALQIVDGHYQNEVIIFNELLKNGTLDEPNLPVLLAMPEEESEFQFPDPYESAPYLNFENEVLKQKHYKSAQNPWSPNVSLGLRYINTSATDNLNFGIPNKDIIEPQLKLRWNLFSKKAPKLSEEQTNKLLDHKLSILGHQLQTAINDQISARIAYDASTQKIENLKNLENRLKSKQSQITPEKDLQINSLKYTFELDRVKAVSDYYISTSKMLLFF